VFFIKNLLFYQVIPIIGRRKPAVFELQGFFLDFPVSLVGFGRPRGKLE